MGVGQQHIVAERHPKRSAPSQPPSSGIRNGQRRHSRHQCLGSSRRAFSYCRRDETPFAILASYELKLARARGIRAPNLLVWQKRWVCYRIDGRFWPRGVPSIGVVARRGGESLALSRMTTRDTVHRRIFLRQWRFSDVLFNSAYHPPSPLAPMSSYCPSALPCWLWSPFGNFLATMRAT